MKPNNLTIWRFTCVPSANPAGRGSADLAASAVGDQQQQRQQDEVGDDRAAAVADEGQGDAGQRDHPGDAADDHEGLDREDRGQAGREQLREAVVGEQRDLEAAGGDQQVDQDHPAGAEEAELVDDQRVDRVGLGRRQQRLVGAGDRDQPLSEAFAEEAAVGLGEDRLQDLVPAAPGGSCVGVEPDFDPIVDVGDGRGEEPGAEQEHRHPDHDEGEAPGRHVEQGEEGGEEHQRAAEVADEDEHEHRGAPDDQHRAEVLERRQGHAEHPPGADDQHLAVLAQVAGEEDDDADLRELGRLEGRAGRA